MVKENASIAIILILCVVLCILAGIGIRYCCRPRRFIDEPISSRLYFSETDSGSNTVEPQREARREARRPQRKDRVVLRPEAPREQPPTRSDIVLAPEVGDLTTIDNHNEIHVTSARQTDDDGGASNAIPDA